MNVRNPIVNLHESNICGIDNFGDCELLGFPHYFKDIIGI